ncbi:hypothetical protein PISMIDRAFT_224184 [Pisolithus microcarpus 441]|uniref:Uncharacterized protein n=1 Tax=Pisolithus microcarpus 441 TaxID=765257 RepID=A0A0C9Z4V6_9AGAM|nr:hypothetical protein BKA83DRAFT_224184 [Pisolithus microcarpus]KIK17472.1 hypothetical protein PISMIDRAFT_224184 [Pisolithus microcarpus 441]
MKNFRWEELQSSISLRGYKTLYDLVTVGCIFFCCSLCMARQVSVSSHIARGNSASTKAELLGGITWTKFMSPLYRTIVLACQKLLHARETERPRIPGTRKISIPVVMEHSRCCDGAPPRPANISSQCRRMQECRGLFFTYLTR